MPTVQGNKIIDKINERIQRGEQFFSFEYFPPKTEQVGERVASRRASQFVLCVVVGVGYCGVLWGVTGCSDVVCCTLQL